MKKTRKIALFGLLTALCFGLSYIEFLIPFTSLGVPGIKMGLANLCVMAALYLAGLPEAAAVSLIRIILSWLIFGSFSGFLYSLAGGVLSLGLMAVLKKCELFSPVGVSAAGGAAHNVGQIAVAMILTETPALWYYLPILLLSGVAAGAVNGIILTVILARLKGRNERIFDNE